MASEKPIEVKRELVLPGEMITERGNLRPGIGTYLDDEKIYASMLGIKNIRAGYVNVIPLAGRYIPRAGECVIGKIIDIAPTNWMVDINSPYPALLHISEVPWKVEFGATASYLGMGECLLAEVQLVDEIKRVSITMNRHGLRKLTGGQIVEITPSKVPRVIGRAGSMITMIKNYTRCRLFVGQNGRIWIDGEPKNIIIAIQAIKKIEQQVQVLGLTDAIKSFLEAQTKSS